MASHPKPFSGERRLFELLKEQQEPFLLDVYILDRSPTLCWPGDACKKILKRKVKFMQSMLARLLHGKAIKKALNWGNGGHGDGSWSFSYCFSDVRRKNRAMMKFRRLEADDSSPLSPVSVLDSHSDDSSPEIEEEKSSPISKKHIEELIEELLQSLGSRQPILDCEEELKTKIEDTQQILDPDKVAKIIDEQICSLQRQSGNLSTLRKLIEMDITSATREWSHFKHEMQEIVMEIGAAISEEIINETILEMLKLSCTLCRS